MKFILQVALMLGLVVLISGQNCRFSTTKAYDYSDILKCLDQVPFSATLRTATMANVRKTMQLYAFRDIVKNSPESPLTHISVDLDAEFTRIEQATYNTDYDFQSDLAGVFLKLKDAHTLFVKVPLWPPLALIGAHPQLHFTKLLQLHCPSTFCSS